MPVPPRPRRTFLRKKPRAVLPALAGLVLVGAAVFLALPHQEEPRPVTLDEAQRLAMTRFTLYEAGTVRVDTTVEAGGGTTTVHGLVDFRTRHAVGRYTATRAGGTETGLIAWDTTGLAVAPGPASVHGPASVSGPGGMAAAVRAAAAVQPRSWSPRAYTGDPLDSALRLVMSLAADRPDNPQLLTRAGPRYLREETLGATAYAVLSGPRRSGGPRGGRSPLTYWVDGEGRLGRLEAVIASLPHPARMEFAPGPAGLHVPARPWPGKPGPPPSISSGRSGTGDSDRPGPR
ncbi:hypothetical protein AB0467_29075 [Streptomyces sp. NPDC052095]|uniref:hypothetical protein n=1 Tax=unclassified Streptomyces TaxID=2593676 RepID=UPI00344DC5E8